MGGEPVFAGTRVPVYNLFDYLKTAIRSMSFWSSFPR
jgi:uncharacterized protein (DUF433 family)